jgi:hypothetical protein
MSHRHLLTIAIKYNFLIINCLWRIAGGRQSRRSARLNTVSGFQLLAADTPATESARIASVRCWRRRRGDVGATCPEPMRPHPAATSRQRTAGIARVAHHAQATERMVHPRSQARRCATGARTAIASDWLGRQHCCTPSGWHPAGSLLRHGVHTCVEKDKELLQPIACGVTSSSLAPTKCAAQQPGHAQTRLRKRRCESGAGPAQLTPLPCASTGAALSGHVERPACRRGPRGHFRRGRLPRRCVRGDSVGGGVLRSSSPWS